jgi:phosphoglycerate dehydrogenase-like enzyme
MLILSHTTNNLDRRADLIRGVHRIIPQAEIRFVESDDEVKSALKNAEIFLTYRFHQKWWPRNNCLKWVHIGGAGVNHILFPKLVASQVVVTNCKGMHSRYMAEYVLTAMLYFSQKLQFAQEWQTHRNWLQAKKPMTRQSFSLKGKWVLIVGAGAVGSAIGKICYKMAMKLLVITRSRQKHFPWAEASGSPSELFQYIQFADFVVITLPLTGETKGLFDARMLGLMKPNAVLINVSRGGIVEEDALIEALNGNKIGGACLDCFEREPLAEDSPLFGMKNLLLTPHIAGNFPEYTAKVIKMFLDNLKRYIKGEELQNVVDLKRGY